MYQRFLKTSRWLTLAVGVSASLLGFTGAQAAELKWAAQNDILTLDPHSQNHATTNNIVGHAYEALVRYDKNYKIEPSLATWWGTTDLMRPFSTQTSWPDLSCKDATSSTLAD